MPFTNSMKTDDNLLSTSLVTPKDGIDATTSPSSPESCLAPVSINSVTPVFYIPSHGSKLVVTDLPANPAPQKLSSNSNLLLNSLPQLQISTMPSKNISVSSLMKTVQSSNSQKPLFLSKSSNTFSTYITMLKPGTSQSSNGTTSSQKFVIAPMPKLTSNRLPATKTTNSVQSKIALLPVTSVPSQILNLKVNSGETTDETSKTEIDTSTTQDVSKSAPAAKIIKHGVSILKKNCVSSEKVVTISVDSPTTSSCTQSASSKLAPHKTGGERRRKASVFYRKDLDDDTPIKPPPAEESLTKEKYEILKLHLAKNNNSQTSQDEVKKVLKWNNGLGNLPGSNITFKENEFGFLEYVTKSDSQEKPRLDDDLVCLECGCHGTLSEFINREYCSSDCQSVNTVPKRGKKITRKRPWKKAFPENSVDKESSNEEFVHNTSNENSQDKLSSAPWASTKNGFSWPKYLDHVKSISAPLKYFKDGFPYSRNGFKVGMKLEGIDPVHPKYFCVLTVVDVYGFRIRLHFDGYSDNYDFWVNADSMDIFPPGWCEKHGHDLLPPGNYEGTFNWNSYIKSTKGTAASKTLFANRSGSAICPNGFRIGMKLEAVDRKNTSLICVSTITDMMDNRILVHFDSWDDIYDYWADPTSPYIHPVGWCDQNGHSLTPPNNYPNPEKFNWEDYLKETKSVAAPVRAFKQRPACGFKKGMRLEAVDKRVPQFIRVATIEEVRGHQLLIKYDGWRDRFNTCFDSDSPDIHAAGWCNKTGHKIMPPLIPTDVYDYDGCQTVGCKGVGNIKGPKYCTHTSLRECPYADENMDYESKLPDRLLSPGRQPVSVVPVSRDPPVLKQQQQPKVKNKSRSYRMNKLRKSNESASLESFDSSEQSEAEERSEQSESSIASEHSAPSEPSESSPQREEPMEVEEIRPKSPPPSDTDKSMSLSTSKCSSVERECKVEAPEKPFYSPIPNGYYNPYKELLWQKHSKCLKVIPLLQHFAEDPRAWKIDDVSRFISMLDYAHELAPSFKEKEIDGDALLMLDKKDLLTYFFMDLGPAIKLYNTIVILRRRCR